MEIDYDQDKHKHKHKHNRRKHGLSLGDVERFDWDRA